MAGNSGATFATGEGPEERDGMTFGPDGNLYVSSLGRARVLRFDGTTGAYLGQFVAPGSGGLSNASDVRFAADGTLYVTGFSAAAVFRYQGPFGPSPGAFLEVAPGIHGLLHRSSWSEEPEIGSTISVRIAQLDIENKRMSLVPA